MATLTPEAEKKLREAGSSLASTFIFSKGDPRHSSDIVNLEKTIQSMSPAARDKIINAINKNPDVVIAAAKQKILDDPKILDRANQHPDSLVDLVKDAPGRDQTASASASADGKGISCIVPCGNSFAAAASGDIPMRQPVPPPVITSAPAPKLV